MEPTRHGVITKFAVEAPGEKLITEGVKVAPMAVGVSENPFRVGRLM
jgi:hypothetical protein